jgi:hypothetical protein
VKKKGKPVDSKELFPTCSSNSKWRDLYTKRAIKSPVKGPKQKLASKSVVAPKIIEMLDSELMNVLADAIASPVMSASLPDNPW